MDFKKFTKLYQNKTGLMESKRSVDRIYLNKQVKIALIQCYIDSNILDFHGKTAFAIRDKLQLNVI